MAGSGIFINGNINGDFLAVGQSINILGKISEDAIAAGSDLNFAGDVGSDIRAAGSNVVVGGNVAGDTILAGNNIQITSSANLNGDVRLAGNNITVEGVIRGNARLAGTHVMLDGKVVKNITIDAGQQLVIGSNADIQGQLTYNSPNQATVMSGAKITKPLIYNKTQAKYQSPWRGWAGFFVFSWLFKFVAILAAALIGFYLFPKKSLALVQYNLANFGWGLLRGFVLMIIIPIAAIIAMFIIVGLIPALIGLTLYALVALAASVYSAIFIGSFLFKYLSKKEGLKMDWLTILVGALVTQLLMFIPFVGGLIVLIVWLSVFGNFFNLVYQSYRRER